MSFIANDINVMFRPGADEAGRPAVYLARMQAWLNAVKRFDSSLEPRNWRLTGDSVEEAHQYPVFSGNHVSDEALAVIQAREKRDGPSPFVSILSIWNGIENAQGATIDLLDSFASDSIQKSNCEISLYDNDGHNRLGSTDNALSAFTLAMRQWRAIIGWSGPYRYFNYQVFDKRPGVGWMLYLPRHLTRKQVPEAAALVPVMDGRQQLGTVIISVIDKPFSVNDPAHIRAANAIEVRLVDQDLLPTFQQIQDMPV